MRNILIALSALLVGLLSACAGSTPKSGGTPEHLMTNDSRVDITYTLGHSQHRFVAEARPGNVFAQQWLEQTLIKEGPVDPSGYASFAERVGRFVTESHDHGRTPSNDSSAICRSPYSVVLRVGTEKQTAQGCRSSDEGLQLARIAREAEFLLYSVKH